MNPHMVTHTVFTAKGPEPTTRKQLPGVSEDISDVVNSPRNKNVRVRVASGRE